MQIVPDVIYEDNHLLVCHKPSGWLVQGDKTGDLTLLDWGKDYIKHKFNKPGEVFLNPVHRLDRPVSGLVVFARTSKGLERMAKIFQQREVKKTYLAVVGGQPPHDEGTLRNWLLKDHKKNITKAVPSNRHGSKEAVLMYKYISKVNKHSLIQVTPETGRPHQIRVQLAKMGCPIQGDLKYGYTVPNNDKSISLHAFGLKFVHPVKKETLILLSRPQTNYWRDFELHINDLGRKI